MVSGVGCGPAPLSKKEILSDFNLNKNEKKRYNLASALSRTFTRLLDLIFVLLILIAIFFAIFSKYLDYKFSTVDGSNSIYSIES